MKTLILDASKIDPAQDTAQFFCGFYNLPPMTLAEIRRKLYASEDVIVTEVFNWPTDHPNWKEICLTLESIQQHSPSFYVIWGPETTDARTYEIRRQEEEGEKDKEVGLTAECKDKSNLQKDVQEKTESAKAVQDDLHANSDY